MREPAIDRGQIIFDTDLENGEEYIKHKPAGISTIKGMSISTRE